MSESDDLYRLLSEPVIPEGRPRRAWYWVLGAATLIGLVALTVVAGWWGESVPDVPPIVSLEGPTTSDAAAADPTTSTLPPLQWPEARIDGSMARDPENDLILLLGGRPGFRENPFTAVWIRDADGSWWPVEATLEPSARELAPLTYDASSRRVLVFGGSPDATLFCGRHTFVNRPIQDVWAFDGMTRTWDRLDVADGPSARWGHSATYLPDLEKVLVFGGIGTEFDGNIANLLGDTWLFDPQGATWESIGSEAGPKARACHAVAYDPRTEAAYMWGGQDGRSTSEGSLWAFEPSTSRWRELEAPDGPSGRWLHQMVHEPRSGLLYVIGGFGPRVEETDSGSITSLGVSDEVWAFDPATLTWEQKTPAPTPMSGHAAAAEGDGSIVVFYGRSTFVYDAGEDAWTDVTPYELLDEG